MFLLPAAVHAANPKLAAMQTACGAQVQADCGVKQPAAMATWGRFPIMCKWTAAVAADATATPPVVAADAKCEAKAMFVSAMGTDANFAGATDTHANALCHAATGAAVGTTTGNVCDSGNDAFGAACASPAPTFAAACALSWGNAGSAPCEQATGATACTKKANVTVAQIFGPAAAAGGSGSATRIAATGMSAVALVVLSLQ
jgi:hypothetical protein